MVIPGSFGIIAVPGYAGLVFDHGFTLAGQPVEEGGFTHIGPADDGDNRFHSSLATEHTEDTDSVPSVAKN